MCPQTVVSYRGFTNTKSDSLTVVSCKGFKTIGSLCMQVSLIDISYICVGYLSLIVIYVVLAGICSHLHSFYNVLHMIAAFLHDFYMITYVL